jgi:osmotically inducible lipoprotein OsmE
MSKPLLAALTVLVTLVGCSASQEQIYRDQPLVAHVTEGMSKQQVLAIGGPPASVSKRTENPGTCLDYQLTQSGQQQAYHVSLDAADKVDHKGFINCAGWERMEKAAKEPPQHSGGGY